MVDLGSLSQDWSEGLFLESEKILRKYPSQILRPGRAVLMGHLKKIVEIDVYTSAGG